jgi:membrane-bound lytic murein transglycosylase D
LHRIGRRLYILLPALLAAALWGCGPLARPVRFTHHFVPPSPPPVEPSYTIEEPPAPDLFAHEIPNLLAQDRPIPRRSLEVEIRIGQAERLFEAGSALMVQGKVTEGRAEMDRALEVLAMAPAGLPERAALVRKHAQMVEAIHRLEVEVIGQGAGPEPVFDPSPLEDIVDMTFPVEPGLKGKVRDQLLATVSQLPLELSDPVLSYINYFSTPRGNKRLVAGLTRAGRYAAMIKRILDEEGLPQELIFMAQAESAFLPRAVSRKRATGMWQFIRSRGIEYGLMQSPLTDDRLDPEKATRAAARHLRDLYRQFGDWYLAIAAYNCGPLNVERAIQRTGYADFWELHKRNVLPRETANYLPIILAMIIMAKNPGDYNLQAVTPDAPLEYDTIGLTAPTHLALIADLADRPLQQIRELNPAVLKLVAPAGYPVHVPKGSGGAVMAALESIPEQRRASWRAHRVSPSETVAAIARHYNTSAKSIAAANGAAQVELQPEEGNVLLIPVAYPGSQPAPRLRSNAKKPAARPASKKPAPRQPATRG